MVVVKSAKGVRDLRMGKTEAIEKRLKDYKGCQVYKIIDNKGRSSEKTTYMLNDYDGNNMNCFSSLQELKKFADATEGDKNERNFV